MGTTVWDASIVLSKYFEKNAKKGECSRVRVRGRRAIELGAGVGLAGMAFALLGADVCLTDTTEPVLALLRRNVETNITPTALRLRTRSSVGGDFESSINASWQFSADTVGTVTVAELDWGQEDHYAAVNPPFDFVLAADCVYSEAAVPYFLRVVLAMAGSKGIVIICNEFRSQTVHDLFMKEFGEHFAIKKVSSSRMDAEYQHPLIHIYTMKRKKVVHLTES